jgi:hypothetical protein
MVSMFTTRYKTKNLAFHIGYILYVYLSVLFVYHSKQPLCFSAYLVFVIEAKCSL